MSRYKFHRQVPALGVLGAEGGSLTGGASTLSFRCDPVASLALFVCTSTKGNAAGRHKPITLAGEWEAGGHLLLCLGLTTYAFH